MIFHLFKWHFDINWYKFEKRWADVFQIYPNAIYFNPPQFCPSLSLLSFPVFCLSSSTVLSRYFITSVNSMTSWSMLKLPKIAWSSPFNGCALYILILSFDNYFSILSSCHNCYRYITKAFLNSYHFYLFTYYLLYYVFSIYLSISLYVFVQLSVASISLLCFLRWVSLILQLIVIILIVSIL